MSSLKPFSKQKKVSHSLGETHKIAEDLVKSLKGGDTICLSGELGSGKTTFTQGIAKALGIKHNVTSPTFVIFKEYPIMKHKNIKTLYHFDCYRIEDPKEILELGFEEILRDKKGVCVIEWADKIKSILPKKRIDVGFEFMDERTRRIKISKN